MGLQAFLLYVNHLAVSEGLEEHAPGMDPEGFDMMKRGMMEAQSSQKLKGLYVTRLVRLYEHQTQIKPASTAVAVLVLGMNSGSQ